MSVSIHATKRLVAQAMRSCATLAAIPTVVVVTIALGGAAPPAGATDAWGLNGTYIATSNGEWAKTNEIFRNEASIRSTWTVSTTCSYPTECTGTVVSDWGWRAPIYQTGGVWFVKHVIDNWQPCPDGPAGPGLQVFRFAPTNPDGDSVDPTSPIMTGADETTGASGTCGVSKTLFISMPFKLVKAG